VDGFADVDSAEVGEYAWTVNVLAIARHYIFRCLDIMGMVMNTVSGLVWVDGSA
jgi:hypothetical protein